MSDDLVTDLSDAPFTNDEWNAQERLRRIERATQQYELVRGDRPAFGRLSRDLQETWISGVRDDMTYGRSFFETDNTEFDLARNRELRQGLVADGHNPIVTTTKITWLDGRVTDEEVIGTGCKPMGRDPARHCVQCLHNMYGNTIVDAVDVDNDIDDRIAALEYRVLELEAANDGVVERISTLIEKAKAKAKRKKTAPTKKKRAKSGRAKKR